MIMQQAVKVIDDDDEFFGDIFSDEIMLLEEIDPEDLIFNVSSVNQDLEDIIDLMDEDL